MKSFYLPLLYVIFNKYFCRGERKNIENITSCVPAYFREDEQYIHIFVQRSPVGGCMICSETKRVTAGKCYLIEKRGKKGEKTKVVFQFSLQIRSDLISYTYLKHEKR